MARFALPEEPPGTLMAMHFCGYNREGALRDHDAYVDFARTRILPVFDGINQEANEAADRRYHELLHAPSWGEDDGSGAAEEAFDHGRGIAEALYDLKQKFSGLVVAGLYHLWEKEFKAFALRELQSFGLYQKGKEELQRADRTKLLSFIKACGYALSAGTEREITVSCLISNVTKHGEGASLEKLYELESSLFGPPGAPESSILRIPYAPMLEVSPERFERLAAGIRAFWADCPEFLPVTAEALAKLR